MSEIGATDDEAAPDLGWMIARAWRLAARAIRTGRAGEAMRWLSVHARLTAMAEADETPDPGTAPAVTAKADPATPAARRTGPGRSAAAPELHQLHQLHRAIPRSPAQTPTTGPDPP
ncbi:hypothetical protein [Brevundimonas sp.]|uniref:hypothetical protein n=1 Tax=Brevundimonas sp. TaxID=1871086 RepID=UPI0025C10476|nr:hypothetical protein [Brevundimonas sp.]